MLGIRMPTLSAKIVTCCQQCEISLKYPRETSILHIFQLHSKFLSCKNKSSQPHLMSRGLPQLLSRAESIIAYITAINHKVTQVKLELCHQKLQMTAEVSI